MEKLLEKMGHIRPPAYQCILVEALQHKPFSLLLVIGETIQNKPFIIRQRGLRNYK